MDLTIGWQYDLALAALVAVISTVHLLRRWLTHGRYERRHRRQVDQHLAETAVRVPIRHADEWDWPRR